MIDPDKLPSEHKKFIKYHGLKEYQHCMENHQKSPYGDGRVICNSHRYWFEIIPKPKACIAQPGAKSRYCGCPTCES